MTSKPKLLAAAVVSLACTLAALTMIADTQDEPDWSSTLPKPIEKLDGRLSQGRESPGMPLVEMEIAPVDSEVGPKPQGTEVSSLPTRR